jgi:hypothetical protein
MSGAIFVKTKSEFNISFKICGVIHTCAMLRPTTLASFCFTEYDKFYMSRSNSHSPTVSVL